VWKPPIVSLHLDSWLTQTKEFADGQVCADKEETIVFGSGCLLTFAGHGSKAKVSTCISNGQLLEVATEIFNDCINNPKVDSGGCVDLADSTHVCFGNSDSSKTCV